jgi:hypothetical protein
MDDIIIKKLHLNRVGKRISDFEQQQADGNTQANNLISRNLVRFHFLCQITTIRLIKNTKNKTIKHTIATTFLIK